MGWIGREALGLFRPSLADVFVYGVLLFYGQVMRKTDKPLHWHVGSLGILPLGASASDFCRFPEQPDDSWVGREAAAPELRMALDAEEKMPARDLGGFSDPGIGGGGADCEPPLFQHRDQVRVEVVAMV